MPQEVTFYSQYGEDRELSKIFSSPGLCVEVGACDGITHSNSYFFEQRGWECILVEPNPEACKLIRRNRTAKLFECGASSQPSEFNFYACSIPELSSFSPDRPRIAKEGGTLTEVPVAVRTLDSLLSESRISRIDFITIDVEGTELEVLRGFDLKRWKPRVLILEDPYYGLDMDVWEYLQRREYKPFRMTGCNVWYAHESDEELYSMSNFFRFGFVSTFAPLRICGRKLVNALLSS